MLDEQIHSDHVLEEAMLKDSDVLDDDMIDSSDEDADDIVDIDDDEASAAGQVVPVIINMTHTVIEDEAGLRIDKLASKILPISHVFNYKVGSVMAACCITVACKNQKFVSERVMCCS